MPSMGMYTEEGVLTAWLRQAGAGVTLGEPVAEITTEKATFEIPAPEEGILHPVAAIGTTLRVEVLMGYILPDGEAPPAGANDGGIAAAKSEAHGFSSIPKQEPPPLGPPRASPVANAPAAQPTGELHKESGTA